MFFGWCGFQGAAVAGAVFLLLGGCAGPGAPEPEGRDVDAGLVEEVEAWHQERIASLRDENGWLTLVGLFWLEEGENTFGSAEDRDLVFPAKAPAKAGVLRLENGRVFLDAEPGVEMTAAGEPVTSLPLVSDLHEDKTRVHLGSLNFYVLERGGRVGVRLKDSEAEVLARFHGIERFPVDLALRFEARWQPYDPPKAVQTPNILGQTIEEESPGVMVVQYQGAELRLEPTSTPDGRLFLVFGDATNGDSTYGGGRFLSLDPPIEERVVVDFNKAYNPPCVFTPYATCPLPRAENKLQVAIEAGEKMWGGSHEEV